MTEIQWVEVRGTRIRLLEKGSGSPLLYLHGGAGGGEWLPFLEALSDEYHVFAPEHPGFGESDDLSTVDTMEDLAYFYLDFMDQMGIDQAYVVGSSLGGWLAAELAVIAPHRISKLVLSGAAGLRVEGAKIPDLFMLDDQAYVDLLFHNPEYAHAKITSGQNDPNAVLLAARNRAAQAHLAWNPYYHRPKLRQRLYRANMPVLLLWGEHDGIFPPVFGEEYESLLPNATFHVIPNCGHLPAQENTEAFLSLALPFLNQEVAVR